MAKRRRFTPEFKAEVVLEALRGESSQAELCRRHNSVQDQLSKWKQQAVEHFSSLFTSADQQSSEATERIAELERTPWAVDPVNGNPKKSIDVVGLTPSQQRHVVETLRKEYSMREICQTLGFNKSTFYYQPKLDPFEDVLRAEIQRFAAAYPTYGYRRIRALLLRQGYTVGYKRVSRLMKEENLSVSVKRVCQTTRSFEDQGPWVNRVENLEVCRTDQVWVGDITYVRLNRRFIYVALLMDVFTRMIRAWRTAESAFDAISNLATLRASFTRQGSADTSF